MRKYLKNKSGITLVELMVTILISTIVIAGIGVAMVDSQRGFNQMYERAEGQVVTDAYVARAAFDAVCRKSSVRRCLPLIGELADFAEVYYYNDVNSPSPDRYAHFRVSGGSLVVDYGLYVSSTKNKTLTGTQTLANNVTAVEFAVQGSSMVMTLSLKKGNQAMTVTCSSLRHND
jgi:type II secretory pathway component PulJ